MRSAARRSPPSSAARSALVAAALVAGWTADAAPAAAENLLRGPHPFLRDNDVSLQVSTARGYGRSIGEERLLLGYGYMLEKSAWLDLEVNLGRGGCQTRQADGSCAALAGRSAEVLAGLKYRFRTDIPLLPYAKAAAGPIFLFPSGEGSAAGIAIRGGAGLTYFFFDWLGASVEAALCLGEGFFGSGYTGSRNYAVLDFAFGAELQF